MVTTKTATKADALKVAKRQFGEHTQVEFCKAGCTKVERGVARVRVGLINDRIYEINAEIDGFPHLDRNLLEAARFVTDTDGGEPSIPRLREVVQRYEHVNLLKTEKTDLLNERREISGKAASFQYSAFRDSCLFRTVLAQADSWAELIEAMNKR